VQLHKALKFRNEERVRDGGSVHERDIGNATISTKISFEYQAKTVEELKENGVDIEGLKEVPFQARILYNTSEGHRYMRVLTQLQRTTQDRVEAEKELSDLPVIHQRITQASANLA
jgi:hypothetical protein